MPRLVWQHDVLHYTVFGSLADLVALCVLRAILSAGLGAAGACLAPHGLTRRWQIVGLAACAAGATAAVAKLVACELAANDCAGHHDAGKWCVLGLAFGWSLLEAALIASAAAGGHELLLRSAADSSGRRGAVNRATDYPSMRSGAHEDRASVLSRAPRGKPVQARTLPSGERGFIRLDGTSREKGQREQRESERKMKPESGRQARPRHQPDISARREVGDRRKTQRKASKSTQKRSRKSATDRTAPGDFDPAHAAATVSYQDDPTVEEKKRNSAARHCDSAYCELLSTYCCPNFSA